ncbi:DUF177 domain-containing protein [Palleronia sp.]|uniref:YceD family protein n=1 Tax=Palleronia sp. TaxID=1940284 RepID=UPI0035C86EDD
MPPETDETRIRLTGTRAREPHEFDLRPGEDARAALAAEFDLSALRKLRLAGRLVPAGKRDWRLEATLGATVVQPCGVTLEPVTTRIDEEITRHYMADWTAPDTAEQEMPDETEDEPLPAVLDLMTVITEELSLAIPAFPRAEGADAIEAEARPEGAEPIRDEDTRPFAGLRDALSRGE